MGKHRFPNKNKLNKEGFLKRVKILHGDKYDYTNSIVDGYNKSIEIICPIHGSFWQKPSNHIRTTGCFKCGQLLKGIYKRKSVDIVCKQVYDILPLNFTFDCSQLFEGINHLKDKVFVKCNKHGEFKISLNNLLRGRKCPICKKIIDAAAYKKHLSKEASLIDSIFYILLLYNTKERFYKIGISTEIDRRIMYYEKRGYIVEKIEILNLKLDEAVFREQTLLLKYKEYQYTPLIKFSGCTECISLECNFQKLNQ